MVMNQDNMGELGALMGEFEMISDMDITTDIKNYNLVVNVELPAEALEAQDMNDLLGDLGDLEGVEI